MDTLSHALWGCGLFGYKYKRLAWLSAFFGAMPDLISFGALIFINILTGDWVPGKPALETIPSWLFLNYSIGHSFIVSFAVIGLMALWRKPLAFAMLAWPFHIVLDFPFHSFEYFPTPMFWPLSDYKIDGIPWSHWYIWLPNVAGLILLFYYRRRQNQQKI